MRCTSTLIQEAFEELAKKKNWSTPQARRGTREIYALGETAGGGQRWRIDRRAKPPGTGYDDSEMPTHGRLTSREMYFYLCGRIREA